MSSLQNNSSIGETDSKCFICWTSLTKNKRSTTNTQNQLNFDKICFILKVNLSNELSWRCDPDGYPFCAPCSKRIQQIIRIHQKLERVRKDLENEIEEIKTKLKASETHFISTNLKTINFRNQALLGYSLNIEPNIQLIPRSITYNLPSADLSQNSFVTMYASENYDKQQNPDAVTLQAVQSIIPRSNSTFLANVSNQSNVRQYPTTPNYLNNSIGHSTYPNMEYVSFDTHSSNHPKQISRGNDDDDDENEDSSQNCFEDDSRDADYQPNKFQKESPINSPSVKKSKKNRFQKYQKSTELFSKEKIVALKRHKSSSVANKTPEIFSPLRTLSNGKMFYEDIEIIQSPKNYICGSCGLDKFKGISSISLRKMKIHIKGVHLNAYRCEDCNKKFTSRDILLSHTKAVHQIGFIPCAICGKPIRGKQVLINAHLWTHKSKNEKEEAVKLGMAPRSLTKKSNDILENPHQCTSCGKCFARITNLRLHMNSHLDPSVKPQVKCPKCDKTYSSSQSMKLHYKASHDIKSVVRFFKCHECDIKYIRRQDYNVHYSIKHAQADEKKLTCTICNKKFFDKGHLRRHLERHRSASDFKEQCDICSLRFLGPYSLKLHKRKIHPKPKNSKVYFDIAKVPEENTNKVIIKHEPGIATESSKTSKRIRWDKLYNADDYIKTRFKTFAPFQTRDDGKLYFEGYEVLKLEEDKYSCITCSFSGSTRSLKEHITGAHLGLYKCQYCNTNYKSRSEATKHLKTHYIEILPCQVCGKKTTQKRRRHHFWQHKNPQDMAESINSGDLMPITFRSLTTTLAKTIVPDLLICKICTKSFDKALDLNEHWENSHTELVVNQLLLPMKLRLSLNNVKTPKKNRRLPRKNKNNPKVSKSGDNSSSEEDEYHNYMINNDDSDHTESSSYSRSSKKLAKYEPSTPENSNDSIEQTLNTSVSLTPIPHCLTTARNIKVISDDLVSIINSKGKTKLITLHQNAYYSDSDSSENLNE